MELTNEQKENIINKLLRIYEMENGVKITVTKKADAIEKPASANKATAK